MTLRRIGFGRYEIVRETPALPTRGRGGVIAQCSGMAEPIEKDRPARSEPYRRLVAQLACKNCGIVGYSQHAHGNQGKGMSLKTDDRNGFPLCCDRPGVRGCHSAFDSGAVISREARRLIEQAWGADTRRQIQAAGDWPANLPLWSES